MRALVADVFFFRNLGTFCSSSSLSVFLFALPAVSMEEEVADPSSTSTPLVDGAGETLAKQPNQDTLVAAEGTSAPERFLPPPNPICSAHQQKCQIENCNLMVLRTSSKSCAQCSVRFRKVCIH